MLLPKMKYSDGIGRTKQTVFGGLDLTAGASDGEIADMRNVVSDSFPVLSSRGKRQISFLPGSFTSLGTDGKELLGTTGGSFWYGGSFWGDLVGSFDRRSFATLGNVTVIFPDKKYFDSTPGLTERFGSLEAEWSGNALTFEDGTYMEEAAEANTVTAAGVDWSEYFRVGDAVTISGCTVHPENNKTPVIREIDGDKLRFYEHTFTNGEETGTLKIKREVPDLDFVCVNENRMWGCRGDTVYCSKLGDVFNWNVFDGLDTDSFAVNTGSAGDFTACVSYAGYPVFFKEDQVYKVYGNKPSNFEVLGAAREGVKKGCERSLAVAAETLFYLSPSGVAAYTGGMPRSLSAPFGQRRFTDAAAGSDGKKYYAAMTDGDGERLLYVYDPALGLWHIEDETDAIDFTSLHGNCFQLGEGGKVSIVGQARTQEWGFYEEEDEIGYRVEFADFVSSASSGGKYVSDPDRKGVVSLRLRLELDAGGKCEAFIRYDRDRTGEWKRIGGKLTAEKKRSYYLPLVPRRCDSFRIKLEGKGGFRLYSMAVSEYSGSALPT